jgi:lipid II:glycine glycyltransferase (peptidoglycan interpeptide bridge formation enzyme)
LHFLFQALQTARKNQKWKYLQMRPLDAQIEQRDTVGAFMPCAEYYFHSLDLSPSADELFRGFDRDSVQRRIQRAERAGLSEKSGRSEDLLEEFYGLFLMTRRRQRVPPTPFAWFRNLLDEMGQALQVRVAYKDGRSIAAILTLQFRNVVYYKYGCSDARFNKFGATPWLFWKAISSAKSTGAAQFDFGRTEQNNPGLLAFKNQWVPSPKRLVYWRYPNPSSYAPAARWKWNLAKATFALLPGSLQAAIGNFLYPHMG